MAVVRDDIKQGCADTGHSIADLSRAANIPYQRLSGALNGYWSLGFKEETLVRQILIQWREEAAAA